MSNFMVVGIFWIGLDRSWLFAIDLNCYKFSQKCRKLVVAGPRDSLKSTWASVFLSIVPFRYIASITKERTFSTAMINSDIQLVFLD